MLSFGLEQQCSTPAAGAAGGCRELVHRQRLSLSLALQHLLCHLPLSAPCEYSLSLGRAGVQGTQGPGGGLFLTCLRKSFIGLVWGLQQGVRNGFWHLDLELVEGKLAAVRPFLLISE